MPACFQFLTHVKNTIAGCFLFNINCASKWLLVYTGKQFKTRLICLHLLFFFFLVPLMCLSALWSFSAVIELSVEIALLNSKWKIFSDVRCHCEGKSKFQSWYVLYIVYSSGNWNTVSIACGSYLSYVSRIFNFMIYFL